MNALRHLWLYASCLATLLASAYADIPLAETPEWIECMTRQNTTHLRNCTQLVIMRFGVTGSIPTELGLLTDLQSLSIPERGVIGTIPTEVGLLSKLTYLQLNNNRLTGTIPSGLANTSADVIILNNNFLTGTIPMEYEVL
eukprot:CAMPEP_0118938170 /NCGR_PEP_ID=MMETSP1169-20130426/24980_1 /TAXON_ID=36882 /ORGANISM="Pyramimonas obovata, Strain CCMP722" /LENGTH=140 /DNA_ID=CAMNT_0006882029 /DNA_START=155 /DNA_END=573 /DNA_ORIENTATION=+